MGDPNLKAFGRDVLILLGLPAAVAAGILAWWRPWEEHHFASDWYWEAERGARSDYQQSLAWQGFHLKLPEDYVVLHTGSGVEILQAWSEESTNDSWAAHLALFPLTVEDQTRFSEQAGNCDLAPGRCWVDSLAGTTASCQNSAGIPDPSVYWTPHITCQVPELGIRFLLNASNDRLPDLHDLLVEILASRKTAPASSTEAAEQDCPPRGGQPDPTGAVTFDSSEVDRDAAPASETPLLPPSSPVGHVVARFVIDSTGLPDLRTLSIESSPDTALARVVRAFIPKVRFVPAQLHGCKVRVWARWPFDVRSGNEVET